MAHDVFISYSSDDQKIVEGLSVYLEQNGIRCFVAYRDIPKGVVWTEVIVDAIENCKLMIVVFSENFNRSPQVNREIELCSEEKKPILTFKIQNAVFTGTKKYYLKNLNWIDAFPNPQEYFGELCESIKKLLPPDSIQKPEIKPEIKPVYSAPIVSEANRHILKIRPNLDCIIFVDGEQHTEAPAGKITKLPLNKGTYGLEFVSTDNKDDKYTIEAYTLADPEQLLLVDLESASHKRMEEKSLEFMKNGDVYYKQKDYAKAFEWYQKAANQGNAVAQKILGNMYSDASGVKQDYTKAIEWYQKAANQGNADAQYNLGNMYSNGYGVEKNNAKALEWFQKAFEWYQKAANQDNADAQYKLGNMYYNGQGVQQDYAKTFVWYQKAANQGNVNAQWLLGIMYNNGQGVQQDYAKVFEWHQKAANQDNANAQYSLGWMYKIGHGVKQDYTKAKEWYQKAANQGNADAQNELKKLKAKGY